MSGLVQGASGLGLLALEAFDGGAQLAVAVLEGGPLVVRLLQLSPRVGQRAARALRSRLRCQTETGGARLAEKRLVEENVESWITFTEISRISVKS